MKSFIAALLLLGATGAGSVSAASTMLTGSWEAARTPDDERVYLVLKEKGKAEIVAEYDTTIPGQDKRRGRSTSFGTWTMKGDDLLVTYSKIRDRLRYSSHVPLSAVGLEGNAPALKPVGKPDPHSKLGTAILWKAPHEYRMKSPPAPSAPAPGATAPGATAPADSPAK